MIEDIHTERITGEMLTGEIAGSSLLVFSVDPQWGNIYFWLGRERKNPKWPQGSETWSDFGGRPMDEHEDPCHVAAREFLEETSGMLRYFEHDTLPRMDMEDIAESLRRKEFNFQMTMWTQLEDRKRLFVTYVKQIPWSPEAAHEFLDAQNKLFRIKNMIQCSPNREEVQRMCESYKHPAIQKEESADGSPPKFHVLKDFLEKKAIRLWSIPLLRNAIEVQLAKEKNGDLHHHFHQGIDLQRVDRFRSCFIPMIVSVLRELPYYEPMATEHPGMLGAATFGGDDEESD